MLEIIRAVKVNCMCQCMQLIVYSVAAFMHTVIVSFYSVESDLIIHALEKISLFSM